jgi:CNT family concentrative nucleoside transporter
MHAVAGMAGLVVLAWLFSEDRRGIPWRAVLAGIGLEVALALVFLKIKLIKDAFLALNDALLVLERATQAGTSLVFGYLGGAPAPFQVSAPEATFILAFRALPIVLVISALSALLFYWRVLPAVVHAISWLLRKSMGVGGVVGLSTAANVFVGMVEAPLLVRPYLARETRAR